MLTAAGVTSGLLDLPDIAAALHPAIAALADRIVMQPFSWMLVHRVAGMTAAASGQWDDAERHFDLAIDQARSRPHRLEEPTVHFCRAKMLLARGRPDDQYRATELLDLALAGYQRSKAGLRVDLVRRLRDSVG
jgi:hypothetical protein